ncbi:hypothetical protein BDZ89DRAFT_1113820 [Hymenopellis radicata]|nr:hypothetical protein BDZ89DRAFT_1113820 [Hymenopellis radicata]
MNSSYCTSGPVELETNADLQVARPPNDRGSVGCERLPSLRVTNTAFVLALRGTLKYSLCKQIDTYPILQDLMCSNNLKFVYSHSFPSDTAWLRWAVYFLLVIDTIITIIGTILGWHALVAEWGTPSAFNPLHWSLAPLPFLSGLVAFVAQGFYSWRIYKLQGSVLVPMFVMMLSTTSWAMAGFCGIRGQIIGISRALEIKPEVSVWLGGATLCDAIITSTLVFYLFRHGRRSPFEETRSLMSKLVTLTIETGMVTAFTAFLELLFFLVFPTNNMHFIPFLSLSKMYSNCLLATLNSRVIIRLGTQSERKNPLWIDVSMRSTFLHSEMPAPDSTLTPQVHITTTVLRERDVEMVDFDDVGQRKLESDRKIRELRPM